MQPQGRSDTPTKPARSRAKIVSERARKRRSIANWDRRTLDLDRRSTPFLRYEEIRHGIISDLGGEDRVSTAEAQLADRAAFICMKLEMMQIADLAGRPMDLQKFGELVDRGRRSFETIGLSRRAREVDGLDTYLASPKDRDVVSGDATSKQPHAEREAGTANGAHGLHCPPDDGATEKGTLVVPTEPEKQREGAS